MADAVFEQDQIREEARLWILSDYKGEHSAQWYAHIAGFEIVLSRCREMLKKTCEEERSWDEYLQDF